VQSGDAPENGDGALHGQHTGRCRIVGGRGLKPLVDLLRKRLHCLARRTGLRRTANFPHVMQTASQTQRQRLLHQQGCVLGVSPGLHGRVGHDGPQPAHHQHGQQVWFASKQLGRCHNFTKLPEKPGQLLEGCAHGSKHVGECMGHHSRPGQIVRRKRLHFSCKLSSKGARPYSRKRMDSVLEAKLERTVSYGDRSSGWSFLHTWCRTRPTHVR